MVQSSTVKSRRRRGRRCVDDGGNGAGTRRDRRPGCRRRPRAACRRSRRRSRRLAANGSARKRRLASRRLDRECGSREGCHATEVRSRPRFRRRSAPSQHGSGSVPPTATTATVPSPGGGTCQRVDATPAVVSANACLTGRVSTATAGGTTTQESYSESGLPPSLADEFSIEASGTASAPRGRSTTPGPLSSLGASAGSSSRRVTASPRRSAMRCWPLESAAALETGRGAGPFFFGSHTSITATPGTGQRTYDPLGNAMLPACKPRIRVSTVFAETPR